ncbi:hypothetical protein M407DRAFT_24762 [Tulasnella calospora MUT 4182]|uniref:NADP-dependent oxidoreductase domain-containing protein n=1 Tax=Tulasnella calospora MUT 4182 TaxID=1051891 RepID=A0A0C3KWV4_9AGAM|nr:hypothetical protein M407DRAFT_24762 [Tulasnella calospora MUT 4182]
MSAVQLGGTAIDTSIHKIGLGLMTLTWGPDASDERSFGIIKTAIELTPPDQKLFLNSAEFYGEDRDVANLEMLSRFFAKFPELADRTFLSVKGTMSAAPEAIIRSVTKCLNALKGHKKIDLFQCCRVDPTIPVESAIKTLANLIKEGKFDHIGLSECSAGTLRRANAVHPITAVEIEISPFSYEDETRAVISASQELNVTVIAYSPLGHGFLTGKFNKEDLGARDIRRNLARFQDDAMAHNQKIVDILAAAADARSITAGQLCIAWVAALGSNIVPLPGTTKVDRLRENMKAIDLVLTFDDLSQLTEALAKIEVRGGRYFDRSGELLWG